MADTGDLSRLSAAGETSRMKPVKFGESPGREPETTPSQGPDTGKV